MFGIPTDLYDLIFVDGPTGDFGRAGILVQIDSLVHDDTKIVLDDTNRQAESLVCAELVSNFQFEIKHEDRDGRGFCVLEREKARRRGKVNGCSCYLTFVPSPFIPSPGTLRANLMPVQRKRRWGRAACRRAGLSESAESA